MRIVSDSGSFALLCENMTSSTKPEIHNYCIADRGVSNHGHVLPLQKIWTYCLVFEICERTNRQTNKHTDTLIEVIGTPIGGEVINHRNKDSNYTQTIQNYQ